jgi:hypothetical protein
MSRALDKFQGQNGFTVGTTGSAGYWAIQMLENTTFSTVNGDYDGTLTGITIGSGNIIYGRFDSFTAGTGKVIAYKSS